MADVSRRDASRWTARGWTAENPGARESAALVAPSAAERRVEIECIHVSERFRASEPLRLLALLRKELPGWKRSTLERRIRTGCVQVNGATRTTNDVLRPGDEVCVEDHCVEPSALKAPAGIVILHDDDEFVAIDKPAGLLSVSTDGERDRTALALLRSHLSRPRAPVRLWPVHRIDRETSGVLLFAKSSEACDALQSAWSSVEKRYLVLVEGRPVPAHGVIDEPLVEDRALFVRVGRGAGAKDARTRYRTLTAGTRTSLLEVELDTGRRHQIRAHLAWLGCPVVGDPRYGTPGARLGLHAVQLSVPRGDGSRLVISAPVPRGFQAH